VRLLNIIVVIRARLPPSIIRPRDVMRF
jgi:hypothetical protein